MFVERKLRIRIWELNRKSNIYILVILLISIKCLGQTKVIELKKYAYSKCLDYNYQKIDSTFYQNL